MIKLLGFLGLVALIVAVPATHSVFAAKPAKVSVCHVNSSNSAGGYTTDYDSSLVYTDNDPNDGFDWSRFSRETHYVSTVTYHLGRVIEVDESAVDAHVGHGDSTRFFALNDFIANFITNTLGSLDVDISREFHFNGSAFSYDLEWTLVRDGTNGVIKNANCYWTSFEIVYD